MFLSIAHSAQNIPECGFFLTSVFLYKGKIWENKRTYSDIFLSVKEAVIPFLESCKVVNLDFSIFLDQGGRRIGWLNSKRNKKQSWMSQSVTIKGLHKHIASLFCIFPVWSEYARISVLRMIFYESMYSAKYVQRIIQDSLQDFQRMFDHFGKLSVKRLTRFFPKPFFRQTKTSNGTAVINCSNLSRKFEVE